MNKEDLISKIKEEEKTKMKERKYGIYELRFYMEGASPKVFIHYKELGREEKIKRTFDAHLIDKLAETAADQAIELIEKFEALDEKGGENEMLEKYHGFLRSAERSGETVEEYKTFEWFCEKYKQDQGKSND